MISASQVKRKLYSIFELAVTDSFSFKAYHKQRVFIITITPTNEKFKHQRWHERKRPQKKTNVPIELDICNQCQSVRVSGTCINKTCSRSTI